MLLPYGVEIPIVKRPGVTYTLVGLNIFFFLLVLFTGAERRDIVAMQWGFIPDELTRVYPIITNMFLHGGWVHLISNMYFLWIFGRVVEHELGIKKYIALYFAAGILANIAHLLTVPRFFSDLPCIGASGAISGVLGMFIVMAPRVKVKCFYFFLMFLRPILGTIELPSLLFIGGWFLMQLLYALTVGSVIGAAEVAYWAHIGGFLFGMLAVGTPRILQQSRNLITRWNRQREFLEAITFAQKRDWSRASGMLETLKATSPERGDLNILLPQMYSQMGYLEEARTLANKAFKDASRSKNQAQVITAYYMLQDMGNVEGLNAHDHLVLGRSFGRYHKTKQATGTLMEALRKFPGDTEADLILYELGDIYLRVQDHERAREIYSLFLEAYPNSKLYKSAEYCLHELQMQQR